MPHTFQSCYGLVEAVTLFFECYNYTRYVHGILSSNLITGIGIECSRRANQAVCNQNQPATPNLQRIALRETRLWPACVESEGLPRHALQ